MSKKLFVHLFPVELKTSSNWDHFIPLCFFLVQEELFPNTQFFASGIFLQQTKAEVS